MAQKAARTEAQKSVELRGDVEDNTVRLRGRVSSMPVERELPSGSMIITFRLSVARAKTAMTSGSRQSVDWVDCTAWTGKARRVVRGWAAGDEVEVTGALRRRFYGANGSSATRLEVEVLEARRAAR